MPRFFTLAQAERALPEVERLLRDAIFHKEIYQKSEAELEKVAERIRYSGGARVNPAELVNHRARRDTSAAALKNALEQIEQAGALVKDLDIGLIDFLTLYQNREVCLCWKLGEEAIRFWHGTDEGFRGRKAIDDEFLENHQGDTSQ